MITGTHVVAFSKDADATRAFLRDVLAFGAGEQGDVEMIQDFW